jgi:glycosyltransferase involved in cell wall biosynthesis
MTTAQYESTNIVLVSNGFQSDYEAGFANGLAANGQQILLISSDRTLVERLLPGVQVCNLRGSQEESRPAWRKALQLGFYFVRLANVLAWRRPVTHLNGLFLLSRFKGRYVELLWEIECRVWRALSHRLILTVHNVLPHGRDDPSLRQRMRSIYTIPDRLIVHTAKMRQRLIDEFFVDPEKIAIMEHGIDRIATVSAECIAAVRNSLEVKPRQKLVLSFGIVQRYKGIDLLVNAAKSLGEDTRIHIAGRCNDSEYQGQLEALIAQHSSEARVTWENQWLSEARVDALLGAADLLVLPYRDIDQSGVLFAAMRHGLPVVAFDVGSFRQYLDSGMGIVVEPENVVALAAAIQTIDCGPQARAKVRELARNYLWSETVKPILEAYVVH